MCLLKISSNESLIPKFSRLTTSAPSFVIKILPTLNPKDGLSAVLSSGFSIDKSILACFFNVLETKSEVLGFETIAGKTFTYVKAAVPEITMPAPKITDNILTALPTFIIFT